MVCHATSNNGVMWALISSSLLLLLQHAPLKVAGQSCDEYKFNVSACMLYEGSDTMAACQSCLVGGLNVLQGMVPNPQVSTASTNVTGTLTQCDRANGVLCQILQMDCRESCLLTSCYNATTMWAACIADTYDLPNCNVTCPDALKNHTNSSTGSDNSNGGSGGTSGGAPSGRAVGGGATIVVALVAWSGLAAMAL
jgi:hypothetical protein